MSSAIVSVLCAALAAFASIMVAIIESKNAKQRKRTEERAAIRERESRLAMQMQNAAIELGYVTSIAVTGGHTNGNVEAAQKKARDAQKAYEDFLQETAAHIIAG